MYILPIDQSWLLQILGGNCSHMGGSHVNSCEFSLGRNEYTKTKLDSRARKAQQGSTAMQLNPLLNNKPTVSEEK